MAEGTKTWSKLNSEHREKNEEPRTQRAKGKGTLSRHATTSETSRPREGKPRTRSGGGAAPFGGGSRLQRSNVGLARQPERRESTGQEATSNEIDADFLFEPTRDDEQLTDVSLSTDEDQELVEANASPAKVARVERTRVSEAAAANIREKRKNVSEAGANNKVIAK